jgi:hypothetical protein
MLLPAATTTQTTGEASRDPMVKKMNDEKQKVDTRANYLKLVSL